MAEVAMSITESKLLHLSEENELLLQQLHQVQEELEHYLQLNEAYARQNAGLKCQLRAASFIPETATFFQRFSDAIGLSSHAAKLALRNEIKASGLFDDKWYLGQYSDVAAKGCDPLDHYLQFGAKEDRNPSPGFDSHWYLTTYPDVAAKGINPLEHFIRHGKSEGRQPCPESADAGKDPVALERQWLQQARDEQAGLAAQRQAEIEALRQVQAKLEEEKSALAGRRDELEQTVAALTQARDEQAGLAAQRQAETEALRQMQAKLEEEKSAQAGLLAETRQRVAQHEAELAQYRQQADQERQRVEESFRLLKEIVLE